jgi:hypothetical protein
MNKAQKQAKLILDYQLKSIKESLPKSCTFLASITDKRGNVRVEAVINRGKYDITIPEDLKLNKAHVDRIRTEILSKC